MSHTYVAHCTANISGLVWDRMGDIFPPSSPQQPSSSSSILKNKGVTFDPDPVKGNDKQFFIYTFIYTFSKQIIWKSILSWFWRNSTGNKHLKPNYPLITIKQVKENCKFTFLTNNSNVFACPISNNHTF